MEEVDGEGSPCTCQHTSLSLPLLSQAGLVDNDSDDETGVDMVVVMVMMLEIIMAMKTVVVLMN